MPRGALAIDIGATKIALALVDSEYKVLRKIEVRVEGSDSQKLWKKVAESAQNLISSKPFTLTGVGIGSAGPIDIKKGKISPVNIPVWREFPIVQSIQEIVELDNVLLYGDAMTVALAEHRLGAGRGLKNLLGMVVSTGIGGGLIIENQVFFGDSGNSSFIGHQSIDFQGEICACGRSGCVEYFASGPRMVHRAVQDGWNEGSDFVQLAESARAGETISLRVIDEGTRALAIGIVNTLANLDIHHVVLGGGVSEAGEIYWRPLRKHLENESNLVGFLKGRVVLRQSQLNRDAGLIGAALAVMD